MQNVQLRKVIEHKLLTKTSHNANVTHFRCDTIITKRYCVHTFTFLLKRVTLNLVLRKMRNYVIE